MKLKRNFFTIILGVIFISLVGFVFIEQLSNAILNSASVFLVGGMLISGMLIYLVASFLIREKCYLNHFEQKKLLPIFFECLIVISCISILVLYHTIEGLRIAIFHSVLILCIYFIGRIVYGRLNAILSTLFSTATLLLLENINPLGEDATINLLCIFIPYASFISLNRLFGKKISQNVFLLIFSYVILSLIFSVAIALNPLTVLLFGGCLFSLLFSKPEQEHKLLANGLSCFGLFFVLTGLLLFTGYTFVPELFYVSPLLLDKSLPLGNLDVTIVDFIINKLLRIFHDFCHAFITNIVTVIMIFFSILGGFYSIRKRTSYFTPFVLTMVGFIFYYLLFCKNESHFYYVSYMMPLFISYGISNSLFREHPTANTETIPTNSEHSENTSEEDKKQPEMVSTPKMNKTNLETTEIPEWKISEKYIAEHTVNNTDNFSALDNIIEPNVASEPDFTIEPEITIEPEANIEVEANIEPEISIEPKVAIEPEITIQPKADSEPDTFIDLEPKIDTEPTLIPYDTSDNDEGVLVNSKQPDADVTVFSSYDNGSETTEEQQLDALLERLDISDHIKRMAETAQEDMADVIEREEEQIELYEALPLKPSKSTLPKYKKPNFDFQMEPVSIPLDDSYSNISEYDEVPTIHELESRWKSEESNVIETVAKNISDESKENEDIVLDSTKINFIHSEEINKKNGHSNRSYHRITIR